MSWTYPVIMFAALLTGALLFRFTQKPLAMTAWEKLAVILGGFCGGMMGARLPFLLADLPGFLDGSAWFDNGKTIVSGLVGGYLGVQIAEWAMDIRQRMCDSFAVPLAGAIAVGRLACFSAGCCYGKATSLPWGVDFGDGISRHPTQLYESMFHLVAAVMLFQFQRRGLFRGQLIKLYFVSYFAYRFLTEFIRPEPPLWLGLTGYQYAVLVLTLFFTVWCCRGCRPLGAPWLARWTGPFFSESWARPKKNGGHFVKETTALCPTCLQFVAGETYEDQGQVYLRRTCPEHGEVISLVSSDRRQYYLRDDVLHPAPGEASCCCNSPAHKTCVALLEITAACNLSCPVCFANSPHTVSGNPGAAGSPRVHTHAPPALAEPAVPLREPYIDFQTHSQGRHRPFAELSADLDRFLQTRGALEVLQLSGGEPLLHPDLLRLVDYAKSLPIDAVMINTNGLELLRRPNLTVELARRTPRLELYLQFDGLKPAHYKALRGEDLLEKKLAVLRQTAECGVPTTLVCTVARAINEDQLGPLLQFGLSVPHVRGICFQPATWTGRFQPHTDALDRITLADVVRLLCEQTDGMLTPDDFQPLPCSHPNCCSFTFLARRRGMTPIPLTRIARLADHVDQLSDRVNFDLEDARRCCRAGSDPADFFRVFIKPFMDAYTFDAERADECCIHVIQPGGRAVSFCRFNTLERHEPEVAIPLKDFIPIPEVVDVRKDETRDGTTQHNVDGRGRMVWIVAGIVVAGGVAPVLLYWLLFGWIPTVTPEEAKHMLREPKSTATLVDVRDEEVFAAGHIDGAVNWPLSEILAAENWGNVPRSLDNQTMLLISEVGMASRQAAWQLRSVGVPRVYNVRGGKQEWMRSFVQEISSQYRPNPARFPQVLERSDPPQGAVLDRLRVGPDRTEEFPFRVSSLGTQVTAVLAYFFIKPVYTLLALAVAVVLWKRREPDLVALRWSMIAFFLGENACAVNFGFFRETSYLFEYLHSFGMLCAFGFFTYALLEGIDRRILKLSVPGQRCAALGLCTNCIKHAKVPCGLKRMFLIVIPILILLALMLPTADWQDGSYNTYILGQLYHYAHLRMFQQFENWYCPSAAVVCLAVSLAILLLPREDAVARAKIPFAAGVGALCFGMLRMILGGAYDQDRVWFLFWEEATELLFIVGICVTLWIFWQGLLSQRV